MYYYKLTILTLVFRERNNGIPGQGTSKLSSESSPDKPLSSNGR